MLRTPTLVVLASLAVAACGGSSKAPEDNGGTAPDSGQSATVEAGALDSGGTGKTAGDAGTAGTDAGSPPTATPLTAVGTLVVLGDSISQGGGQPPFYYNLLLSNDDTTYPEWTGKDLRTKYGANVMMVNNAVAGAVSSDLPTQVTALPASLPGPVAVVLTIGGNDMQTNIAAILQGVDQGLRTQFQMNLASALGQLTMPGRFGTGVDVHVYEADIYDPSDGSGNFQTCPYPLSLVPPQPSDPFFGEWNAVVDGEVPMHPSSVVAPLHATFHTHGVNSGAANWFYTDCIHPNATGHDAIRGMFWTQITGEVGPAPM
jgi:lysophospholipase L1-like esterase